MKLNFNMHVKSIITGLAISVCGLGSITGDAASSAPTRVRVERIPGDGLQPQVQVDTRGRTHLIWLSGEPAKADVNYAWRDPGSTNWSTPVRVNSTPGSAIAVGTIRGPKLAVGKNGRVHVCWNGSEKARPRPAHEGAPLLYTRMKSDGRGFETERNVLGQTRHLDGGAGMAADQDGRVFVIWHAAPMSDPADETRRAVYLAASTDEGATFKPERIVSGEGSGACGCCGLQAIAGPSGTLAIWYRGASASDRRPGVLLTSRDHGATFQTVLQDPWSISQCPMSSADLSFPEDSKLLAAWETAGQIHWGQMSTIPKDNADSMRPEIIMGERSIKHPVITSNARGEILIAWTVGTGWNRGGSMAWRVLDSNRRILDEGRAEGVPAWGSLAAAAERDGTFVLVF